MMIYLFVILVFHQNKKSEIEWNLQNTQKNCLIAEYEEERIRRWQTSGQYVFLRPEKAVWILVSEIRYNY